MSGVPLSHYWSISTDPLSTISLIWISLLHWHNLFNPRMNNWSHGCIDMKLSAIDDMLI